MSDLVGNSEDRFSHVMAQTILDKRNLYHQGQHKPGYSNIEDDCKLKGEQHNGRASCLERY